MPPLRSIGREQVPFTDLGRTLEAVLAGLLSFSHFVWYHLTFLFGIVNQFSFLALLSQERFRVGAFAGGSAAELPSLEEELAQVFHLFVFLGDFG